MSLLFTHRFHDELRREYEFIQARNPAAAEQVRQRILTAIERLKLFPHSGRTWRLTGTSELVIPGLPYIVIYAIEGGHVLILTLFHTSREFPPVLH